MLTACCRDGVVALFAVVQALPLVAPFAHLVGQMHGQHSGSVAVCTVDIVHLAPLPFEVAGVVIREVRHAIDVNEVGGGDDALELVHPLAAPLGVDVEQVGDL